MERLEEIAAAARAEGNERRERFCYKVGMAMAEIRYDVNTVEKFIMDWYEAWGKEGKGRDGAKGPK